MPSVLPNLTVPIPRLLPSTVTLVPPAWSPLCGLRCVTLGAGTGGGVPSYANVAGAVTPPGVRTVTSTVPWPVGLVAAQVVVLQAMPVPGLEPKTTRPFSRLVPVAVLAVPPAAVPPAGSRAVRLGAGCAGGAGSWPPVWVTAAWLFAVLVSAAFATVAVTVPGCQSGPEPTKSLIET